MLRRSRWVGCALLTTTAVWAGSPAPRVIPLEDDVLRLAPDLELSFDGVTLSARSGGLEVSLSPPYGSPKQGFPAALDRALLLADGAVLVQYKSFCSPGSVFTQSTSLRALRAKLLIARAERSGASEAAAIEQRAFALDPAEPSTAVAAAKRAPDPGRRAALLEKALGAARYETYFEILRQAPTLRELPNVRRLKAATPGTARLSPDENLHAVAGSLLALSVAEATEADCSRASELLFFDVKKNSVVFRRPYLRNDGECKPTTSDLPVLSAMLQDFGFVPSVEADGPDSSDPDFQLFGLPGGLSLRVDQQRRLAQLSRGNVVLGARYWGSSDRPFAVQLVPSEHTLVIETNRDSDVCEGLPAFELMKSSVPLR